jgi:hypothetical protein
MNNKNLQIGNLIKRNGLVVIVDEQTFWDIKNNPEQYEYIEDKKVDKKELCCNVFDKIKDSYYWMVYIDDNKEKVSCMPYMMKEDGDFRVNFCPSCGKSVRNYTFKREEQ